MVHTEETRPKREGLARYRHATQRWTTPLPVQDVDHPDQVIILEGHRFELVTP